MLAILFTILIPVLPILIWKCYNRDKKLSRGEIVVRYVVYGLFILFSCSIMLAFLSDDNTSFWEKIDKSAEFALKYILMVTAAAMAAAVIEWLNVGHKVRVKVSWSQFGNLKVVAICRRYLCPLLPYALAILVIVLNLSLIFDNVLWGDEAFSANTAVKDVDGILQVIYYWDKHPPLYYYWLKLFGEIFGFTGPIMHLASIVPFVLGIILALTFFRKKFGNIPAAFFIMISGLGAACLEYNLEIRMYSLAFLGIVFTYYCSYKVISGGRKSAWIGMVLWGLVAAYSHYYAMATAGILLFCTGVAVFLKYRGKSWIKGLSAVLAYIVGYIPWLRFLFAATGGVDDSWWMTGVPGLDKSLEMIMGGAGMWKIIFPFVLLLVTVLLLAESKIFRGEKKDGQLIVHIDVPTIKEWSDETYAVAVGTATLIGTVAFAYLLCVIMGPVLAERYLYPLSAVTVVLLVMASSRVLALLKKLGERIQMNSLEGIGKAVLVILLLILLVIGLNNYKKYSATASLQEEKTRLTLETIGTLDEDVELVTNGVKHLGWTVLYYYYPDNSIIEGAYWDTEADRFWYFNPSHLNQEEMGELKANGYSISYYGEMQISQYPFVLYYMERMPAAEAVTPVQ